LISQRFNKKHAKITLPQVALPDFGLVTS
jgi:hypothetical protein